MRVLNFYLLCKGLCSKPYSLLKYSYYLFSSLSTVNISVKGDVLMEFQQLHKQKKIEIQISSIFRATSAKQILVLCHWCFHAIFILLTIFTQRVTASQLRILQL